ncbi:MAG: hypothetical protein AAFU53_20615 [Cyanobacteria bacterium J06632_3]
MDFFWLFIIFATTVFSVVTLAIYCERRYTALVQTIAKDLHFQYLGMVSESQPQSKLPRSIWQFALLSKGNRRHFRHLIWRSYGAATVYVGEYSYHTGTRKRRRSHLQTIVLITSPKLSLPEFSMVPEKCFHRVGRLFSYQDINFESHPEFSRKYLLRGANEASVRACFHQGVLELFQQQPLVSVEGTESLFIFYRNDRMTKPQKWYQLVNSALSAYEQFCCSC